MSEEYPLAAGLIAEIPHGLGGVPQRVRMVLVCKIAENGHPVGRELDAAGFAATSGGSAAFTVGTDGTSVAMTMNNAGDAYGRTRSNGTQALFTNANWRAKVYVGFSGA